MRLEHWWYVTVEKTNIPGGELPNAAVSTTNTTWTGLGGCP